jgi:uncharacterized protein
MPAFARPSHAPTPPGLMDRATTFRQGEALVAGKIASHPAPLIRFGERITREGGADVAGWAP